MSQPVLTLMILVGIPAALVLLFRIRRHIRVRQLMAQPFPEHWKAILEREVKFYQRLDEGDQHDFQEKIKRFVHTKRINGGGGVTMTDELLMLAAASAIIPVFHLRGWPYQSLREVVLIPDRVRNPNDVKSKNRTNVTGMVYGTGPSRTVFLSAPSLIAGFRNSVDSHNVGIHEFAHMLDGADGVIDGIPAAYMPRKFIPAWKEVVHKDMKRILHGDTETDQYAATNEAEFFAVLSELYFENPARLEKNHPAAFTLMKKVYR